MTLEQIIEAVEAGKTVHYKNESYIIVSHTIGYVIKYRPSGHLNSLRYADGTFPYNGNDFFIA
jgi:hypothetical protein